MVCGVRGLLGHSVMGVLGRLPAAGSVIVLQPSLVACPVLERAGKGVVAMTTSPSAQVNIMKDCILMVALNLSLVKKPGREKRLQKAGQNEMAA